jgi:hypothetical protein
MVDLHARIPFESRVGNVVLNASLELAQILMIMVVLNEAQNIRQSIPGDMSTAPQTTS